jgi:hypothetical protein
MFYGYINTIITLMLTNPWILSDERLHMFFELMSAIGAVGHGDYQMGGDRITLLFAASEYKVKRKARLTGSKIEKIMAAQDMLSINVIDAVCKLMAFEKKIPDQIGLEILINAELANRLHTKLLVSAVSGVCYESIQLASFLDRLTDHLSSAIWRGDANVSITGILDLTHIKATSPEVFVPYVELKRERKAHPSLSF